MKTFLSSAVVLLALYAQAASANPNNFSILKTHNYFNNTSIQTVSPTWTLARSSNNLQLIGFASINSLTTTSMYTQESSTDQTHSYGLGLHQKYAPWLYTQMSFEQHPHLSSGITSTLALTIGF